MVPRAAMQVTKNRNAIRAICFAALVGLLAGCMPAGPRALLDGKNLLEAGRYDKAVEKLTLATQLLATNAQAWNYLGLARHRAGDAGGAVSAYQQALRFDRELFEAHFNLGCLWLDQNKPEPARNEFTACTLRRTSAVELWLKLGIAHYRLGEFPGAEEAFQKALRLRANDPEALNGLGMVCVQRRRPREAMQHFTAALQQHADYRPALLNLATVLNRDLNDSATAAKRYREYLALQPREADWEAVNTLLQNLERKLAATVRPAATNPLAVTAVGATNVVKPQPSATASAPVVRTNGAPTAPPPVIAPATGSVAVVRAAPAPVMRVESSPPMAANPAPAAQPPAVVTTNPAAAVNGKKVEKPGFFAQLNPFRRAAKPVPTVTALSPALNVVASGSMEAAPPSATPGDSSSFQRYAYLSPAAPAAGDRAAADAAIARGAQSRAANRMSEAAQAFQTAVDADAGYFEARYYLGLAQYTLRDYSHALATWEFTLAIRPQSADARYSFALTLKAAGYAMDAAAELEKLLAAEPNEVRAHLVLGNLCAEQLRDKSKARVHYQRVLELDARHPQATQIRYWLVANPA